MFDPQTVADLAEEYEHGNCFFTRKADGTLYAIVLRAQDGDSMPASVTLPAAFAVGGRTITLVGYRGSLLAVTVGMDGLAVVQLSAAPPILPVPRRGVHSTAERELNA